MGLFSRKDKKTADKPAATAAPVLASMDKAPAADKDKKAAAKKIAAEKTAEIFGVLAQPIVTEKSAALTAQNQYVFAVEAAANKNMVKQAIESAYKVRPVAVNILNNRGRAVRSGRRLGLTKAWKKAIVTLPAGQNIQIQEGI